MAYLAGACEGCLAVLRDSPRHCEGPAPSLSRSTSVGAVDTCQCRLISPLELLVLPMNPTTNKTDPAAVVRGILAAAETGRDHFSILALTPAATAAEVRDQYFRLAKLVHPDLPHNVNNPQARQDATKAFQVITAAHATLADPARRAAYVAAQQQRMAEANLEGNGESHVPINPEVAKIFVHRGKSCIQRRDWVGAQEALSGAAKVLAGDDLADCQINLGIAIFNNTANQEQERLDAPKLLWQTVLKSHAGKPLAAQAAYQLALWTKMHGDMREIGKLLDTVLAIQPNHIEAQREKRLFEQRKGQMAADTGKRAASSSAVRASTISGTGQRRVSSTTNAATVNDKKVGLEKKPTLMERLFGKKL
jgi:hypothetical protein